MSPTTIWGIAAKIGGIAEERSASGRVVAGRSFDDLELELGRATIDLDHDPE